MFHGDVAMGDCNGVPVEMAPMAQASAVDGGEIRDVLANLGSGRVSNVTR
jgi:hypothetical protein